jgi:hypothetical protein
MLISTTTHLCSLLQLNTLQQRKHKRNPHRTSLPNPTVPTALRSLRSAPPEQFLDGGSYLKQKLELHVLSIEERHIRASQAAAQTVVDGAKEREVPVGDQDVKRLVSPGCFCWLSG